MLAEMLAEPGRLGGPVGPDVMDDVRGALDAAAHESAATGGWSEADPLRLAKNTVTWLIRCPRRALAPDDASNVDDLALGLVVDAAAKLAALGARRPVTVDAALGFLAAQGDETVAGHLDALGDDAEGLLA